jgi:plastocyanin
MTNNATKFALGLAVAGIVAAVAPTLLDDKAAWVILLGVFLAAAAVAFGIGRTVGADLPPVGEAGAATPVDPADAPRPSYGPVIGAVAATVLAAGGALGPRYVVVAAVIAAVAITVWTVDTLRTNVHPVDATNVDHRLISPLALPVGAFLLAITIAIAFSRVLLAVSETASWVLAFIVAAVVLAILAVIASRSPASKVVVGAAGVGMLAVLVAGGAGAGVGERDFEKHESHTPMAEITAKNIAFDRNVLAFPADEDVELTFTNLDVGTFHNVAVYTEDNQPVFAGKPIAKDDVEYKFKTPAAGTYRYVCDFHPAMTGELRIAQEGTK